MAGGWEPPGALNEARSRFGLGPTTSWSCRAWSIGASTLGTRPITIGWCTGTKTC